MRAYIPRAVLQSLLDGPRLNDFSAPHDGNIVGDDANDAEIVTSKTQASPSSGLIFWSKARICACTETSSADVGSSATIKEGRRMIARAMATR